jgi:hypothetical protein
MRLLNLNQAGWHANPRSKKLIIVTLRHSRRSLLCGEAAKRLPVCRACCQPESVSTKYETGNEFDFRTTVCRSRPAKA